MKLKNVPMLAGVPWNTGLVSIGWLSFGIGTLCPNTIVEAGLLAIARVLPKALY